MSLVPAINWSPGGEKQQDNIPIPTPCSVRARPFVPCPSSLLSTGVRAVRLGKITSVLLQTTCRSSLFSRTSSKPCGLERITKCFERASCEARARAAKHRVLATGGACPPHRLALSLPIPSHRRKRMPADQLTPECNQLKVELPCLLPMTSTVARKATHFAGGATC